MKQHDLYQTPSTCTCTKIVTRNNFTIFKCQIAKKVESITYPRHDKMDKHRAYC